MRHLCFLTLIGLLILVSMASARTWYITPDGTGDAPTIQAGVDSAAAGDIVMLACGTYYDCTHATPDGEVACVIMKSGIMLQGETGDPDCATIDAQGLGRVCYCESLAAAYVEGVTITGGFSPSNGGGMKCQDADLGLTGVVFMSNSVDGRGGALRVGGTSAPAIEDCDFITNSAGDNAGAVSVAGGAEPLVIEGCDFLDNESEYEGGAIYCDVRTLQLADCLLKGNRCISPWAGGGAVRITHSGDPSSPTTFINCVFDDNFAHWEGGAILAWGETYAYTNYCTFYKNAGPAIAVMDNTGYDPDNVGFYVCRTIIAYTRAGGIPVYAVTAINVEAYCSDWYGNTEGDWVGGWEGSLGYEGNICACPSFCHADAGDFHVCDESPCLPGNHPDGYDCGLIGAFGAGCSCGPTRTEVTTWGAVKSLFK